MSATRQDYRVYRDPTPVVPLSSTLVVGLGNQLRGDDAAGLALSARLKDDLPSEVTVLSLEGEPLDLLEAWVGYERVFLIDASCERGCAGRLHRFEVEERALPAETFTRSSHAYPLAAVIELARTLGRLPPQLTVYALEGRFFKTGEGLSAEVEAALDAASYRILCDVLGRPAAACV